MADTPRAQVYAEGVLAGHEGWVPVVGACPTCGSSEHMHEAFYTVVSTRIAGFLLNARGSVEVAGWVDDTGPAIDYDARDAAPTDVRLPPAFLYCARCYRVVPHTDLRISRHTEEA